MKIRPTDSSGNVPEQPEDVKQKKQAEQPGGPEAEIIGESDALAQARRSETAAEIVSALGDVSGKEELGKKFVDLATNEFADSIAASDLDNVREMLSQLLDEDPFVDGKLERIAGLLEKAR